MKYGRIIVFCDYGLDDAIATLHILDNADMFERIDIVPIGGNVTVDTAFRNAHTLLAAARADKNKVRIIDTREIGQAAADIPDIHGADGMGDMLEHATSGTVVVPFSAFKTEIAETAEPSRDCVLSLGPCTVPIKLGYTPFCTVLMGGATNESPNYGDREFNEAMDADAFKKYAYTATAVATLDTCHDKKFDFEHKRFGNALADGLLERYVDMCKRRNAFVTVYDYVAALAVTDPELFDAVRVRRSDGVEYNELIYKG